MQNSQQLEFFILNLHFPLSKNDLQVKFKKINHQNQICPNKQESNKILQKLKIFNYKMLTDQISMIRIQLLNLWRPIIIKQKTIISCIFNLNKEDFNSKISQEKLLDLKYIFQDRIKSENLINQQKKKNECLQQIQFALLKITQNYIQQYDLKEYLNENLEDQRMRIKKQVKDFDESCFINNERNKYLSFIQNIDGQKFERNITEIKEIINNNLNLFRQKIINKNILDEQQKIQQQQNYLSNSKFQMSQIISVPNKFLKIQSILVDFYNQKNNDFSFLDDMKKLIILNLLNKVVKTLNCNSFKNYAQIMFYKLLKKLQVQFIQFSSQWNYQNQEQILKILVALFKLFLDQVYTKIRPILRLLFRQFKNFKFGYSNYKVLEFLQNLKLSKQTQIHQYLISEKYNLSDQKIDILAYKINVQILNKKYINMPLIKFQKISKSYKKTKVITFCISGFTSQDDLKEKSWKDLFQDYQGEIYAINWESKTQMQMINFSFKTIFQMAGKKLVSNSLSIIPNIIEVLYNAYNKNPFTQAFELSQITGQLLAHLLLQIFPDRIINLVGFSLGTQLIKQIIKKLKKLQATHILNKVVLIGGVADKQELQTIYKEEGFEKINCFSKKDHILLILYRLIKPSKSPCGLVQINENTNINCTDFITGHLQYRKHLYELSKRIELEDDIFYIFN